MSECDRIGDRAFRKLNALIRVGPSLSVTDVLTRRGRDTRVLLASFPLHPSISPLIPPLSIPPSLSTNVLSEVHRRTQRGGGCLSSVQFSLSVTSDSWRPHGLQHARLPCPSPTPGAYSNSCPSSWWLTTSQEKRPHQKRSLSTPQSQISSLQKS